MFPNEVKRSWREDEREPETIILLQRIRYLELGFLFD